MASRPLSPVARRRLRTGSLLWGVALVALWLVVVVRTTQHGLADVGPHTRTGLAVLLLPGALLLLLGVRGSAAARRFNRRDSALADALTTTLGQLSRVEPFEAYRTDRQMTEVSGARLVETERHFDQQTSGNVAGRMEHQLHLFGATLTSSYGRFGAGWFGGAVAGLSEVDLTMQQTTRDSLMGDALFAVLEAPGPAGERDVFRVVSVSSPAAAAWASSLVLATAGQLEGSNTHAGATVLGWGGNLVAQFAPRDISYASDRLRAQAARAPEQRELLSVGGLVVGRNALLASYVQVGTQEPLMLFPARFPVLFGQAVAAAAHQADAVLADPATPTAAATTARAELR